MVLKASDCRRRLTIALARPERAGSLQVSKLSLLWMAGPPAIRGRRLGSGDRIPQGKDLTLHACESHATDQCPVVRTFQTRAGCAEHEQLVPTGENVGKILATNLNNISSGDPSGE